MKLTKTLLRQVHVGHYLDRSGNWTAVVSEAQDFPIPSAAVKYCEERHLKNMELVMIFDDPPSEVRVPIEHVSVSAGPREM